ncbi:hypothetical protein ABZZ17_08630 [Streptomyces sp. NPDC006512]|uniref:hypothetical protein n=1 Tax=Streptomyces sp. NPDC006512 TaxID=3154307 RepID=UPI0033A28AF9
MPIDPYAALNAMLRAEAARFTPPARQPERPAPQAVSAEAQAQAKSESEHQQPVATPDTAA